VIDRRIRRPGIGGLFPYRPPLVAVVVFAEGELGSAVVAAESAVPDEGAVQAVGEGGFHDVPGKVGLGLSADDPLNEEVAIEKIKKGQPVGNPSLQGSDKPLLSRHVLCSPNRAQ